VDPTAAALGEGLAIHCSYGSRSHAHSRDEAAGIADELTLLALSRAGAVLGRGRCDSAILLRLFSRAGCNVGRWIKPPSHKKLG
jgi:hypothetical protein